MASYTTDKIRNVVLLGHSGCGKTSLAETMIFQSGGTTRLGKVEDGNTVSDFEAEEINRTMSIGLSVVPCEWKGTKINILDAPGYPDFQGEMLSGIQVADAVILVLDGTSGVEVGTQLAWEMVREQNKPLALFLNKMDRPNASYRRVIDELKEAFDAKFVPVQLPIRNGEDFEGIVDMITMKAHTGEGKGTTPPDNMVDEIEEFRVETIEYAAEGDDDLMMKYFDGEELTPEEIAFGLRAGLADRKIVPVFCGSATANVAVRSLMNTIGEAFPAPSTEFTATNGTGEEETISGGADGPLAAQVFKTINDQYGRVSYLRIWSGSIDGDIRALNTRSEQEERLSSLFMPKGKEQVNLNKAMAGDIVGVVKLNDTQTQDTLSDKSHQLTMPRLEFPHPLYAVALSPQTQADSAKLGSSITRITEEDLTIQSRYEEGTRQTLLEGMGDAHIDIAVKRMAARFGLNLDISVPKVPMRETVTRVGSAQYRHKKQSGGAGQFGEVHLRAEPMERGEGFEYKSEIFGGSISQPFLPSIEKGIRQVLEEGPLGGYPVVDVRAVVYDGKEHPVDSKDIAFQIAGREAFRLAMVEAGAVLLEPMVELTITIPSEYTGDVNGDISTKRGQMVGMDQIRGNTIITAMAPLAEVQRYATDLRSLTQGRGIYKMKITHYQEVPRHIAEQIIAEAKKEKQEE